MNGEIMNQSSTQKLSLGERMAFFPKKVWHAWYSSAVPFWAACRWIWLTIVVVIATGVVAGILIETPNTFYNGIILVAFKWLFAPAFSQRLALWIVILVVLLSIFSAITAFL